MQRQQRSSRPAPGPAHAPLAPAAACRPWGCPAGQQRQWRTQRRWPHTPCCAHRAGFVGVGAEVWRVRRAASTAAAVCSSSKQPPWLHGGQGPARLPAHMGLRARDPREHVTRHSTLWSGGVRGSGCAGERGRARDPVLLHCPAPLGRPPGTPFLPLRPWTSPSPGRDPLTRRSPAGTRLRQRQTREQTLAPRAGGARGWRCRATPQPLTAGRAAPCCRFAAVGHGPFTQRGGRRGGASARRTRPPRAVRPQASRRASARVGAPGRVPALPSGRSDV